MVRLVCLVIGYVCGLFETSYLIGKKNHIDIREYGSGNAGSTNAMRVMGKKAGAYTLIGDCLKCLVAICLVQLIYGGSHKDMILLLSLYAAAGCILGHNFPFYLRFKGGKGIAASVGLVLGMDWKVFLCAAVIFFLVFFTTHYVSAASISAYLTAFASMIVFGTLGYYDLSSSHLTELYVVMGALTLLAIIRHRTNIVRLMHGNENKIFLSKASK